MSKPKDLESFRDKISTVDIAGKRKWIYAMQPDGKWYQYRSYVSYLYFVVLIALPFIQWRGQPFVLFDLVHGKFVLFGRLFLPQDFILFGLAMLTFLLFIIIFTLAYGRVFCGWVCPQTIFMELVFRKIEFWIEGSARHQMNVDSQELDSSAILRKIAKHIIFFIISFLIANLFLSYIIGVNELKKIMVEPLSEHVAGFAAIMVFSVIFYLVFAFVRELVCTVVCPYGRLQSVLMDKNTIAVAYDYIRGEPRARESRVRDSSAGDCIDCNLCVQVCPTGIDIRNGTQMECTNCTACVDACNLMMKKTGRPLDLIRFASENNIKEGAKPGFTYRMTAYTIVLALLMSVMSFLWLNKKNLDITVMRVPGQILQENEDGTISNLYRIKVINTTPVLQVFELKSDQEKDIIQYVGKEIDTVYPGQSAEEMFFIKRSKDRITKRMDKIKINIYNDHTSVYSVKMPFIGFQ